MIYVLAHIISLDSCEERARENDDEERIFHFVACYYCLLRCILLFIKQFSVLFRFDFFCSLLRRFNLIYVTYRRQRIYWISVYHYASMNDESLEQWNWMRGGTGAGMQEQWEQHNNTRKQPESPGFTYNVHVYGMHFQRPHSALIPHTNTYPLCQLHLINHHYSFWLICASRTLIA